MNNDPILNKSLIYHRIIDSYLSDDSNTARMIRAAHHAVPDAFEGLPLKMPWFDMLLELFIGERDGARSHTVSSLCAAAKAPGTTALRWLDQLQLLGYVERKLDKTNPRRFHVVLSDMGRVRMRDFLSQLREVQRQRLLHALKIGDQAA